MSYHLLNESFLKSSCSGLFIQALDSPIDSFKVSNQSIESSMPCSQVNRTNRLEGCLSLSVSTWQGFSLKGRNILIDDTKKTHSVNAAQKLMYLESGVWFCTRGTRSLRITRFEGLSQ